MVTIELKEYSAIELREYLGTSDNEGTNRKLSKYNYGFSSSGWGKNKKYIITSLPNTFSQFISFCTFKLQVPPQADFHKFCFLSTDGH